MAQQIFGLELVRLGRRRAYYAPETYEWYWVTAADLQYAADVLRDQDIAEADKYSHWCSSAASGQPSQRTRKRYGI